MLEFAGGQSGSILLSSAGAAALFNLIPLLLDAAKAALFQAKVFHFSVLALLVPAIVLSYILLVATASAIQRLATVRK